LVDFAKVLAELARFFDREGARFGLAGAFAMRAHGLGRLTSDLDLVVESKAQPAILRFLASLGYEELLASEGYSNHLHPEASWGRVEFIYLDEHTAEKLFAGAARTHLFAGTSVLVPRAEHLAAMKVHAIKSNPARTFKELADIQFLLGLPGIDEKEIRGYFEKAGLSGRFDEIKKNLAYDRDPDHSG
jgi:hypothetical protein